MDNNTVSRPMHSENYLQTEGTSSWLKWVGWLLVVVVLVGGGFYLGQRYQLIWKAGDGPLAMPQIVDRESMGVDSGLYDQVSELMKTKYLRSDELDKDKMLYGAISGMVASAGDPYTAFFDPEQNQESEEQLSGKFSGIGAELGYDKDRQIVVIAPIPDTPAEKAGLKAGDVILGVDKKSIKGQNLQEVVNKIRGESGTKVVLTVRSKNDDASHDVAITRAEITVKSLTLQFKGKVAYVQLSRFGETTNDEWDSAVQRILDRGAESLVLDLRNNPGGYLDSAIHIGSEFFKDGVIVEQKDSTGKVTNYYASGNGRLLEMPVAVLINEGSASASEIVAGALQSRDRATVVGVTSFGKGSVQQVIDLAGNTSLHVTIAKWLTPAGKNIDEEGISPDVVVKLGEGIIGSSDDPQLTKALSVVGQK